MSYITIIILILLCFSVTDFILPNNKLLHKQLFKVGFYVTFFLCLIKYYYGADMVNYYEVYEEISGPMSVIGNKIEDDKGFEIGFMLFMSIFKWLGLSYWWMTAVVTIVYFYAIYQLFKIIPSYKLVVLLLLFALDYNLIFFTHRQCLAVSFYILMFLAYINKKYFAMLLYVILSILMHKSAIFVTIPVLFIWSLKLNPKRIDFITCFFAFIIMSIIPLNLILTNLLEMLPLSSNLKFSLIHHILYNTETKAKLLLYAFLVLIPGIYTIQNPTYKKMAVVVLIGNIFISAFYRSSAILWRLRSYFIPFILAYIFYIYANYKENDEIVAGNLYKKFRDIIKPCLIAIVLIVMYIYYYVNKSMVTDESRIYETCTIFELLTKRENEIKDYRFKYASKYWAKELKHEEQLKAE